MARDIVKVQLPVQDATASIEIKAFAKTTVAPANGVAIEDALGNKNNSLVIVVEPTATGAVTIKAGDAYPNAMLGDLVVTPTADQVNAILLEDIARFENRDGSVNIDFAEGFAGTIYAVAKRAGIKTEY